MLRRTGCSTAGEDLLRGEVWPTLEVIISAVSSELAKRVDPDTDLALIAEPPSAAQ